MPQFLTNGTSDTALPLVLAHGAGAPMTSPVLDDLAAAIASHGRIVHRFEFEYMASRRLTGVSRPPPRVPILVEQFRSVAREAAAAAGRPVIIGGKSMGGRVASMIADDLFAYGIVAGCVCLGYPFHPPRKPDVLRIAHLAAMACPLLIVQGERDALGSRSEVASYPIDPRIAFEWLPDGDHDLAPRRASGYTPAGHIATAAAAVAAFGTRIDPIRSSKGAVPIAAMPDRR